MTAFEKWRVHDMDIDSWKLTICYTQFAQIIVAHCFASAEFSFKLLRFAAQLA